MNTVTLVEHTIADLADVTPCIYRIVRYTDGSSAGAVYSLCRREDGEPTYRYVLWRIWDSTLPLWLFCMLNPSIATEWELDPTIHRQKQRTINAGGGGLIVVNSGAVRETKSAKAVKHIDPVGPDNERWLREVIPLASMHVAAWGPLACKFGGDVLVDRVFRQSRVPLHRLEITKDGQPKHPLYTAYSVQPTPWELP